MRFATMQDPSETWLVYDLVSDLPAEIAGRPLVGLTKNEAEHLSARANATSERQSHHSGWESPRGQTSPVFEQFYAQLAERIMLCDRGASPNSG